MCFETDNESVVAFCIESGCCSSSTVNTKSSLNGSSFNKQEFNNLCELCVDIPVFKSLIQNDSNIKLFSNLLALVLPAFFSSVNQTSYTIKSTLQHTTMEMSSLSSSGNVVLLI